MFGGPGRGGRQAIGMGGPPPHHGGRGGFHNDRGGYGKHYVIERCLYFEKQYSKDLEFMSEYFFYF